MIEEFSVNFNKLFTNKLKIEEYFILFCLITENEELLIKYITHCGNIDTQVFQKLRNSGFIILSNEIDITFSSISITDETKKLFNMSQDTSFELLFRELLSTYPKSVKRITGGTRPLHNDLARCKKLYKSTLINKGEISLNLDLHQKILLCVQKYYKDHLKDNKQEFMQLLATFLSQRTWEQYLEEVSINPQISKENNNYDAI